jgi:hypothetical protein
MTLTITADQRDALSNHLEIELSAFDDLWILVNRRDFEAATRRALELSDALRLVVEDLGWGEGSGGPVTLSSPPDVLERTCTRLRTLAIGHRKSQEGEWEEARREEEDDRLIEEACDAVLAALDQGHGGDVGGAFMTAMYKLASKTGMAILTPRHPEARWGHPPEPTVGAGAPPLPLKGGSLDATRAARLSIASSWAEALRSRQSF